MADETSLNKIPGAKLLMAKHIGYFSHSKVPSNEANTVHVLKMASALAGLEKHPILYCLGTGEEVDLDRLRRSFALGPVSFRIWAVKEFCWRWSRHLTGFRFAAAARLQGIRFAISRCEYAAFFGVLLGIRVIFETHGIPRASSPKRRLIPRLMRSKRLVSVVAISGELKRDFCKTFEVGEDRVHVLPDGADAAGRASGAQLDGDFNFHVGYTGSLYPGKGLEVVVPMAEMCSDVAFHVVGGRPSEVAELLKRCQDLDNVFVLGHRSHAELDRFLTSFDIVLLPNQRRVLDTSGKDISAWTSPLKMFEYMAHAKAILCSDLQVLREVMIHGENCLLCDPDNVDDWVSGLRRLQDDEPLRKRLGQRAFADFSANYSWRRRAEKILRLFDSDIRETA